jgi:hypothetical protein
MVRMSASADSLRHLGPETFGWRMRRARETSGVQLRDAAEFISGWTLVSHTSIRRLERLGQAPTDLNRKALGCLVAIVYGYDPAEFELSVEAVPRFIDVERFTKAATAWRASSRCTERP